MREKERTSRRTGSRKISFSKASSIVADPTFLDIIAVGTLL